MVRTLSDARRAELSIARANRDILPRESMCRVDSSAFLREYCWNAGFVPGILWGCCAPTRPTESRPAESETASKVRRCVGVAEHVEIPV